LKINLGDNGLFIAIMPYTPEMFSLP
jgi:hypothetical protein